MYPMPLEQPPHSSIQSCRVHLLRPCYNSRCLIHTGQAIFVFSHLVFFLYLSPFLYLPDYPVSVREREAANHTHTCHLVSYPTSSLRRKLPTSSLRRTSGNTSRRMPGNSSWRTGGSCSRRTGGSCSRRTGGSCSWRTGGSCSWRTGGSCSRRPVKGLHQYQNRLHPY